LRGFELDPSVLVLVPGACCREQVVIALARQGGDTLVVAMFDPSDSTVISSLTIMTRLTIAPVIAHRESILDAIDKYRRFRVNIICQAALIRLD
jgi:hypothetical protein